MKIYVKPIGAIPDVTNRVVDGFRAHGHQVCVGGPDYRIKEYDLVVFWGHRKKNLIRDAGKANIPYLVCELGYLGDRMTWMSMGYNGLNGRADFLNENVPPDRWEKYWADTVKPWREGGDYALIMGQVPGDAALAHVDINQFYHDAAIKAKEQYGKVYFRPHPQVKDMTISGAANIESSLSEALSEAAVVITCNSNSGVDAVMAGIPTVAMDIGSMAWDVTTHDISHPPIRPDRSDWGRKLAYCQWLPDEVQSGLAWEHLKSGVLKCKPH